MKTFSYLLILFGLSCFALGAYHIWLRNDPNRLSFNNYHYTNEDSKDAKELPRRILVKDLNIDLPVIPAKVTDSKWETTSNGASFLVSSPIPGNDGNSVIYAHNWTSLFGNLVNARPGETVEVEFADKSRKTFEIEYTSTVSPSESSILASSKDKRITLYTCTGFLDSKRFVVVAILKENLTATSKENSGS